MSDFKDVNTKVVKRELNSQIQQNKLMHKAEKLRKLWTDTPNILSLTEQCYIQQPDIYLFLVLERVLQVPPVYKWGVEEDLTWTFTCSFL